MFEHGEQFEVCEAEALGVWDECIGEFAVAEGTAQLAAHPALQMDFVHGDRLIEPVLTAALLHPGLVLPFILRNAGDQRRLLWRDFGTKGVGVGFQLLMAVPPGDGELVGVAGSDVGQEEFPDAAVAKTHGVSPGAPAVEVADNGDHRRAGSPNGEASTLHTFAEHGVSAHHAPGFIVGALTVEVNLVVGQDRGEPVRIFDLEGIALRLEDAQTVMATVALEGRHKEPGIVTLLHRDRGIAQQDPDFGCFREEGSDLPCGNFRRNLMGPEDAERVAMMPMDDGFNVV